ncbi:hypothetical protein ElyMa_001523600 [Elysia marginata]|uniref:Uncharacterized protein n=1 Tax=Elysia marginata TaxID=1093978 RepID=A0AAV4J739_9GAST|nr:hypothetical protein ElyMa_001523600 [Elysia marginata]
MVLSDLGNSQAVTSQVSPDLTHHEDSAWTLALLAFPVPGPHKTITTMGHQGRVGLTRLGHTTSARRGPGSTLSCGQ